MVLDVARVEVRVGAADEELRAGLVELEREATLVGRPLVDGGEEKRVVVQVRDRREGEPEEAVRRV